jgi:hypothetical protein
LLPRLWKSKKHKIEQNAIDLKTVFVPGLNTLLVKSIYIAGIEIIKSVLNQLKPIQLKSTKFYSLPGS